MARLCHSLGCPEAAITSEITWVAMGVTWGALLLIFAPLSAGTFNPLAIPGKLGLFPTDDDE